MSAPLISLDLVPIGDDHAQKRDGIHHSTSSRAKNCAECRRLKVKCDRKIPCQNCMKKGCGSICPEGSLGSRGGRLVLSNTEDLHAKIEELTTRIQDLEGALAALQAKVSTEPHPLLSPNQVSSGPRLRNSNDPNNAAISTYGSLMTNDDGSSYYFGATGASDWLITVEEEQTQPQEISFGDAKDRIPIAPDLVLSSANFTDSSEPLPSDRSSLIELVLNSLPSKFDAIEAINRYYGEVAWELDPVPRARLMQDFFAPCYDNFQNTPEMRRSVALLYAVFALGTLCDPSALDLSRRYISLSRAALLVDDMVMKPTTTTIDTLLLHFTYVRLRGGGEIPARSWLLLGTIIRLAQALGLHRDPSLWSFSPEETLHRRRTMWELVTVELWLALHFGRPPMISRQHFDVQFPMASPDISEANPNFLRGKYLFVQQCLWPVLDVALAAEDRTTYTAVLRIDKMIRDWNVPYKMQFLLPVPNQEQMMAFETQRTMIFIVRETVLLEVHKSYFAAAVFEPPFEALRSRYSRSVLAAYASSCAILVRLRAYQARYPALFEKYIIFGLHAFDAAILLGTMAATTPSCPLAASALIEFDQSIPMFVNSKTTIRSRRRIPTLQRLQAKAHAAFESYKAGKWTQPTEALDPDLLQGIIGRKPVVRPRYERSSGSNHTPSPPSTDPASSNTDMDFRRSLEGYLRSFESIDLSSFTSNNQSPSQAETQTQAQNTLAPMHVLSSDAFLHGALTGDWAAFPTDQSAMFGIPTQIPTNSAPPTGDIPVPLPTIPQKQQYSGDWDPSDSALGVGDSTFGVINPDQSMDSVFGQPTTSTSTFADASEPFFSGPNEHLLSSMGGLALSQSYGQGVNAQIPYANEGMNEGVVDDLQAAKLWDDFLKGLDPGNTTM